MVKKLEILSKFVKKVKNYKCRQKLQISSKKVKNLVKKSEISSKITNSKLLSNNEFFNKNHKCF